MGAANGRSRNNAPSRIEPQFGQVSENSTKPSRSENCEFSTNAKRSYFANDPRHVSPESAFRSVDLPFSGGTNVGRGILPQPRQPILATVARQTL